jgi:hypothetical protein
MQLGVYTFGDLLRDPATGTTISPEQRLANLLEEIELLGTEVAPIVRAEVAERTGAAR